MKPSLEEIFAACDTHKVNLCILRIEGHLHPWRATFSREIDDHKVEVSKDATTHEKAIEIAWRSFARMLPVVAPSDDELPF